MCKRFGPQILKSILGLGITLSLSHQLFADGFTGPLHDGQIYTLQTKTEATNRWLEGRTDNGQVTLRADPKYSGVLWRVHVVDNGTYTFEAMGSSSGPRWLGIDASGKVVIQKSDSALSTRWKVQPTGGDFFALVNAGIKQGSRFLDAKVESQSLALASEAGGGNSGANWKLFLQASMKDAVAHGDIISLKSLSKIDGPRWLDGSTFDGRMRLQWTEEEKQFSGSRWRIHDNQDGTFSLECLGDYPGSRWLSAKDSLLGLANTTDRGMATRWLIARDESYGVTIKNADAKGSTFLDSFTTTATAGLAPDAGTGHSGAHWQIIKHKSLDPKVEGRWSSVEPLPTVPIHAVALPTGGVLFWSRFIEDSDVGGSGEATPPGQSNTFVFDPISGFSKTVESAPVDPFCSGQAFLPDGRVFVNGGHIRNYVGQRSTQIFDPASNRWERKADMSYGRWYPSTITLPNGDIFTMSGANTSENDFVYTPEVWSSRTNSWKKLPELRDCGGGSCTLLYPWLHVSPNGQIFVSGANQATGYINPENAKWTTVGDTHAGFRGAYMGTSVMYEPGKVLLTAGLPATAASETIDLNGNKQWTNVNPMFTARREPTATILADGTVFITGGNESSNNLDASAAFGSEIWDPSTKAWTKADHSRIPRLYHSSSVLLADGRVMSMGSGFGAGVIPHKNYQLYSPPYLFKGDRPQINSAPSKIGFNQTFKVTSESASAIAKVHLIRLSADTHAFNFAQSFSSLSFTKSGNELSITSPANGNLSAPGPYMLFLINGSGVPSIASMVLLN
jgi:hypothetical protein